MLGEIKLKNCPFCGCIARLYVDNNGVKVMCTCCNCGTPVFDDINPFVGKTVWSENKKRNAVEEAIDAWNVRCNIDGE